MKKLILVVLAIIGISLAAASPVHAAASVTCQPGNTACSAPSVPDPTATTTDCTKDSKKCDLITSFVDPFISFLTVLVGLAVTIALIIAGIQYSMSAGDPQKATNAKNHIRAAIIALVCYLLLWSFLKFIIPGTGLLQD